MTESTKNLEMTEVPKHAFLHMVFEITMESDDHQVPSMQEQMEDQFWDNLGPNTVDEIEIVGSEEVSVRGSFQLREAYEKIPATRWQPAEYKYHEREVFYEIMFNMDGFGHGELAAELG